MKTNNVMMAIQKMGMDVILDAINKILVLMLNVAKAGRVMMETVSHNISNLKPKMN